MPYAPPTIYLALFRSATTDAGDGTEVSNDGTGYARQVVQFSVDGTSPTTASLQSLVQFPVATADWGDVSNWAVMDASAAGAMLFHGPFDAVRTFKIGDQFVINPGGLSISAD